MKRLSIFALLTLAVLLPSTAQGQINIVLSVESDAFPTNSNAMLGAENINGLFQRPDISANGRYIGLEVDLVADSANDDAAVVIDLQSDSRTIVAQEGVSSLPAGVIGGIDNAVEVNNTGQAAFHAGDSITGFWDGTNLTQVVTTGDAAPAGAPLSDYGDNFARVQLTNAGVVGGEYDSSGTGTAPDTREDFLSLGSSLLVAADSAPLPGYVVQDSDLSGLTEAFSEFSVSAEGTEWIAEIRFDDDSTFDSTIAVNGTVVAQEGITIHTTPGGVDVTYDNTLDSDIADGGQWITESRSDNSIDYTLVNGTVILAEAEPAPNGSTLSSLSGVSINSNGDYISLWNTDGDAILILNEDTILVTQGDTLSVDYNGDGTLEDLVVGNFPTEAFNLADDGTLALLVNFDDTTGADVGNALVTLNINDFIESILLGDVNLDGVVDFLDISPFITILATGGFQLEADIDGNGVVDFLDISPFIGILSNL